MGKVNWSRVFLGGLGWWVVFNVLKIVAAIVYMNTELDAAWKALGREFPRTPGLWVLWFAFTYVGGVVAIWLYAAIRPRYGPGPKTAVRVGLTFWLIGNFFPLMFFGATGVLSMEFVVIDAATNLVVMVAAAIVGAWLYKEE